MRGMITAVLELEDGFSATWFEKMPDEEKIRAELQWIEESWKEEDDGSEEHTLMTLPGRVRAARWTRMSLAARSMCCWRG